MERMSSENRATERHPYEEDIRVLSPQEIAGRAVDIGAGGIGIVIPVELAVGTAVELEILSGHAITYGTVCWSSQEEDGFRIGIQFRTEDWKIIELILALQDQEA